MTLPEDSKIIIVGGGTFGLSTALWLLRKNYKNVTVLDPFPVPSEISAGNDVNKLIQSSYINKFHDELSKESLKLWQTDPVFIKNYHETGILYSSSSEKAYQGLLEKNKRQIEYGREPFKTVTSKEDYQEIIPALTGDLKGWKGLLQPDECGWAHARDSLISAGEEIIKLGGKIKIGEVNELIKEKGSIKGVKTKQGDVYYGDKIIISAGASSINVLSFQDQLFAKSWAYAHIKLSQEEADSLRGIPVLINSDLGFFFEPDSNNELKISNEQPGYTHFVDGKDNPESSVPIAKDQIPYEAEVAIRDILRATLPQYADREFVKKRICWCTDTADRFFLIDEHPDYDGSLVLATGDSGHAFKFMPVIGKYISELVIKGKANVDRETYDHWRWRPEVTREDTRIGGDGKRRDIGEFKRWT
ncbi:hypothetical protein BN7_854 [Wickerhamomyces ciferrii]|uniref:FAD dependent oxidoreductase domain-containing protein n=1 Tax=Wickerhamomyces ciferrii (strain ATCC 14091 / BCRC 22168 / CBS 111 / JCM 3599 / NBRC 0793 / NRRL Y-1031 F-60-10) TaxID=1206466 RepID=K0K8Y9_WICCF|nr:uncharacterized protein BN7_854 [Wickerhamomyces ciferrii]CCH41315.1 hypothetical protein BN7_854 [Wickerhamomyces ciferrii]